MKPRLPVIALVAAFSLPLGLLAEAPAAPPPAPEVAKTVEAWIGNWTFDGTVTGIPGSTGPAKVKEAFRCEKAAGGRVVHCAGKGTMEGMGEVEDEALITYDEGMKAVRFIGLSSTGEVHDHTCAWKTPTSLACQPLAIMSDGDSGSVDLAVVWPDPKSVHITETVVMKAGGKVVFDGIGKR